MPEASASSTTSCSVGTSTIGSISFGTALVAGRKRVPRPAAGMTAFRTGRMARKVARRAPSAQTGELWRGGHPLGADERAQRRHLVAIDLDGERALDVIRAELERGHQVLADLDGVAAQ